MWWEQCHISLIFTSRPQQNTFITQRFWAGFRLQISTWFKIFQFLLANLWTRSSEKQHEHSTPSEIWQVSPLSLSPRIPVVFRANRSRFSRLMIVFIHRDPARKTLKSIALRDRINTLAAVIQAGQSITTMPGLCAFITSFELCITGVSWFLNKGAEGGPLAHTFNNLFSPRDTQLEGCDKRT